MNQTNNKIRPCHLSQLFINSKGDVFPCCRVWANSNLKIGHIDDPEIMQRISAFDQKCTCFLYSLRKISPDDHFHFSQFNIEFSLACQGKCAMCCVDAPSWQGNYTYYDSLFKLVDACKPDSFLVQGGEVLVQPKTIEWIKMVKTKYPHTKFNLVTNGCVDTKMVETVESLFELLVISIVGFEPETYKKIMDLDWQRTRQFVETLTTRKKIKVLLKYLVTPLSLHQSGLFIDWGAIVKPEGIELADSNFVSYINLNTPFPFWQRIIERTGLDVKKRLLANKETFQKENMKVFIAPALKQMLSIDDDFISKNELDDIIVLFT